jgi:hypothetical protein
MLESLARSTRDAPAVSVVPISDFATPSPPAIAEPRESNITRGNLNRLEKNP